MFTFTFQFFLVVCTLGLVVVAILTHRADRREVVERADRAFLLAHVFIDKRIESGYYHPSQIALMKKDFDDKYIELITK